LPRMANDFVWNEPCAAIEERANRGEPVKTAVRLAGRRMRLSIADELIEDRPEEWQTIVERRVRAAAAMGIWPLGLDTLPITSDHAEPRGQRTTASF
jgi:hypothetical protein